MLIQTQPIPAGKPCEAVQFTGDISIHPSIWIEQHPYRHFRIRDIDYIGANYVGKREPHDPVTHPTDFQISPGDWIVQMTEFGDRKLTVLLKKDEFEKFWQVVE